MDSSNDPLKDETENEQGLHFNLYKFTTRLDNFLVF